MRDLLLFFPRRYEDRRQITCLAALVPGAVASVVADVVLFEKRRTSKRGLEISSVVLTDGKSSAKAIWFNIPHLDSVLVPGVRVALYGRVETRGGPQLTNPEFEVIDQNDPQSIGRIVPVYPTTAGLSAKWVRRIVRTAVDLYLPQLHDCMPGSLCDKYHFPDVASAVKELHYPQGRESWLSARNRLAFEELFFLQIGLLLRKQRRAADFKAGRHLRLTAGQRCRRFMKQLPFQLTGAQQRVIGEIAKDVGSDLPMNRLLQGDVGSGKTVVAAFSMLTAVDSGAQAVMMAPTEILAQQHFLRLQSLFASNDVKIVLLTGSMPAAARRDALASIASGEAPVVIGTHALFGASVKFKDLALVVVDEQHRFGVAQKSALLAKGTAPHVLVMTATPIPRTLTLSIYGDLEVSVLDELPPGRTPVRTLRLPSSQRDRALRFIQKEVKNGRQAYWVCPLIEESDKLDLSAAYSRFQDIQKTLPSIKSALLHGQMPVDEKETVMRAFAAGTLDLLVATSVIEVGVDVPNASVMVIEDAVRFGVAQLHQLRGRVGRGSAESFCILLASPTTPEGSARIEAMLATADGFKISELDLRQRGPGEVCGVRQHGVTDFRVADLVRDVKLLTMARAEARLLMADDPGLTEYPALKKTVCERLGGALELAGTA